MRTLACLILIALAACEEHGSGGCPGGVCPDGGKNPVDDGPVIIGPDAGCFDGFEPNDTIGDAFTVPLAGSGFNATGITLCPEMDRDHFAVDVPGNTSLQATVTSDGPPIQLSILNAGGTSIVNGTPAGSDTQACAPNLPAGRFFVLAFTTGGVVFNYRLSIQTVPNC